MTTLKGHFQYPRSSSLHPATAKVANDGSVRILSNDGAQEFFCGSDYHLGSAVPGLTVPLEIGDGSLFIPLEGSIVWPQMQGHRSLTSRLETSRLFVLLALVGAPLLLWWIYTTGLPAAAGASVRFVPESVKQQMGQQVFLALQKTALQESSLERRARRQAETLWADALAQLDLTHRDYKLHFFASSFFGANALALPDGTVIVTDDLVRLLRNQPDALLAVLLHEIGHVEQDHSVRMVAQALGSTLMVGMLFGDLDSVAEVLLGGGTTLMQNSFSQKMEREADSFAIQQLVAMGRSPEAFADAMTTLQASVRSRSDMDPESAEQEASVLQRYLSTHPSAAERVARARAAAQTPQPD